MSISPLLREMLESGDYGSLRQMAARLRMSPGGLSMLINEKRLHPLPETCLKISELSGKPVEEIIRLSLASGDGSGGGSRG